MESTGVTGLNPTEAKKQIADFEDHMSAVKTDVNYAFQQFEEQLSTKWYSPKAVEFGRGLELDRIDILNSINNETKIIGTNAIASYNILASANGLDQITDYFNEPNIINGSYVYTAEQTTLQEVGPNGEVGMNIILVKGIVDIFVKDINDAVAELDNVSTNIAFYDPSGELQARFSALIQKLKNLITEDLAYLVESIQKNMETEQDNIEIAKNQATDTLTVNA